MRRALRDIALVRRTLLVVLAIVGVSFALGVVSALLGGAWTSVGRGPAGLNGLPPLALLGTAIVALFVPAAGLSRLRRAVLAAGPAVLAVGFVVVAHLVDPCASGAWDLGSRVGDAPLCEVFGSELNIDTRFHLLLHATPALPLVTLYWVLLGRATAAKLR